MDLNNGFKEWIGAEEIQRMDRSRMDSKNGSEQNGFEEGIGIEWI